MRKIAITNQKGGVGKTVTTLNLGFGLAKQGLKVLILDMDSQGNIATSLGINTDKDMYALLIEKIGFDKCLWKVTDTLHVIPSNDTLQKAELIMAGQPSRETILKRMLANLSGYDYVFLDLAPSLGLINQNAILFAEEAFIPASTDFLGYDALKKTIAEIETINNIFSHKCRISLIIPTMYVGRNNTCKEHLKKIQTEFKGIPIAEPIRLNSKLREQPVKKKSIFDYARGSKGAEDYLKLMQKVMSLK